jgi:hypothetical protein
MTSRLLRNTAAAMRVHNVLCNSYNTAAAMRAHNVLCNSYNSRAKPLQLSSCTFCVVVHSYSYENCIAYFHSTKLVYHQPQTPIDVQRILDRKRKRAEYDKQRKLKRKID